MDCAPRQFSLTSNTFGLPDACILNEDGNLDDLVLRRFLRIPSRTAKKHLEKNFSKLAVNFRLPHLRNATFHEFHMDQDFRRKLFLYFCQEHAKESSKHRLKIQPKSSFECFVFSEIDSEFYYETSKPEKYDELKPLVAPDFLKLPQMNDRVLIPMFNLWGKIETALLNGDADDDMIASAVIGVATVLGPRFFHKAVEKHPKLLEKYQYLIGLPQNHQSLNAPESFSHPSNGGGLNAGPLSPPFSEDIAECLSFLRDHVDSLSAQTLIFDQLAYLEDLTRHIHRLLKESASVEFYQRAVSSVLGFIYDVALSVKLKGVEDISFRQLVAGSWERYLAIDKATTFVTGEVENLLKRVAQDIRAAYEEKRILKKEVFSTEKKLYELKDINSTSFLERKKLDEKIVELEATLAAEKKNLQESDNSLHSSILPPGVDLNNLETNIENEISLPQLDKPTLEKVLATVAALRADYLDSPTVNIDKPQADPVKGSNGLEQEKVSDEKESPPIAEPLPPSPATIMGLPQITTRDDQTKTQLVLASEKNVEEEDFSESVDKDPLLIKQHIDSSIKEYGIANSSDLNSLALECISANFLNIAHKVSLVAPSLNNGQSQIISSDLLEAAFFGMNVWSPNSRAFEHSQRLLNTIDQKKIESWLSQKPMDKGAPFLLFCACFQTALWGGNMTLAPTFLNIVKHYFDNETTTLINDLIHFWNKGATFSLEQLQQLKGSVEQVATPATINLSDWQDKIVHGTRGWAPLRMALSKCLKNGAFTPVVDAIQENKRNALGDVQHFIEEYANADIVRDLMVKSVAEFSTAKIEASAREAFSRTINELRDIAGQWVAETTHRKDIRTDIQEFSRKFPERLEIIVEEFKSTCDECSEMSGKLASRAAEKCISNLLAAIGGRSEVIWSEERAFLWFTFPQLLMAGAQKNAEPLARLNWVLRHLESRFDLMELYRNAFDEGAYHVAQLLLVSLSEQGIDVSEESTEVKELVTQILRDHKKKKEHIELAVGNALVSGLLDEDRHEQLISELDYLEDEIFSHSPFYDIRNITDILEPIEKEIDELYAPRIKKLSEDYQSLLQMAQTSIGADAVPTSWQKQMEEALRNNDVPVVEEMIDSLNRAQAEGTRIREDISDGNQIFAGFLAVEQNLLNYLNEITDPHQICNKLTSEGPLPLDFSGKPPVLRAAVKAISSLRTTKPPGKMSAAYYDGVAAIFDLLGIKVADSFSAGLAQKLKYQIVGGFAHFSLRIQGCDAGPPFTDFGRRQNPEFDLLISHKEWDGQRLEKLFEKELVGKKRFFMISATPLTHSQRNAFSEYCKTNLKTIFLVDPSLVLFLGSLPQESNSCDAIRNFLQLVTPMTYYNTYVGDIQYPPPPEMRYGRLSQIDELLDMNQGAAIVFGGRQLGKSTILNQVQHRFHDPSNNKFSFYFQGDSYFGGLIDESKPEQRERRIWSLIYDKFWETRLLRRKENLSPDSMRSAIKDCLASQNDLRVIIIFDEIDPLLNLDHSNEFKIFRGMRDLVNAPTSQGRFKFIISGLQNVKRFEDSPNYPLNQLGRSLNISIMSVADASKLVKDPLLNYGFQFENPLVLSRVLSVTNRHPSLIQIFCQELVRHLALNFSGDIGEQVVTDSDITRVFDSEDVRNLIRQRFEMTLNLDTRYAIIIYSLALEGRGTQAFSAAQVREAATCWLPELSKKTDMQIEAILEELVGLGVLRKATGKGFALRNSNILMLLGSRHDIEMKLIHEKEKQEADDPLERHAFIRDLGVPSPLTYRDEKQLLGMVSSDQDGPHKPGIKTTQHYTISLVSGSKALGLDQLGDALPYIDDFSLDWSENPQKYILRSFPDTAFENLTDFDKRLRRLIGMAQTKPYFILVKVSGERSAEELLCMIDIAHQAKEEFRKNYKPCKVVFALSPKALWKWLSSGRETAGQEMMVTHICLSLWKPIGMRVFLDQIGFPNTEERVTILREFTEGWYISLHRLSLLKRESPETTTVKKFGARFKKITDLTVKESQHFLQLSGAGDLPWAIPLLRTLIENQSGRDFDAEVIRILIEMEKIEGLTVNEAEQALDWLARLSILEVSPTKNRSNPLLFQINSAVHNCLSKAYD
ncbi:hypothetical protein [Geoalkalibacter halelectricus]|uniref:hypothetical protein n=1 Tax=Geoalkalibacter halelectricus TaxID=2847045 RepID=UPI003D23E0CA